MTDGPFIVHFFWQGKRMNRATPDHEPWRFDDLKNGFWITRDLNLCRESQGEIWIPPSMIMSIEKRNQPPGEL